MKIKPKDKIGDLVRTTELKKTFSKEIQLIVQLYCMKLMKLSMMH